MTLQEILDTIKMKYNHGYSNTQIVTMLNDIQTRIFRTLYKPETLTTIDLFEGNPYYPISFPPESIIDVVVNGEEYPQQNIKYDAQTKYYYITDDRTLGIYPTPTDDVDDGLAVFHYKQPSLLSEDNLAAVPDLDPAWHMLLVFNVCKDLSVSARDNLSDVFVAEINNIEAQYKRSKRSVPHKIQDVYGVGRGSW